MKYIYGCWDWLFPSVGTAIHKEGQWMRLMGKRGPKRIQNCILTRKSKVKRGREIEDRYDLIAENMVLLREKGLESQGPSLSELQMKRVAYGSEQSLR